MQPIARERRLLEADAAYQVQLDRGFPCTLGGNAERLQVATDRDRANWLMFLGACDDAILAGQGATNIAIPIRCMSNNAYTLTYTAAQTLIRNLRSWGFAAQQNLWRIKDALAIAPTGEALSAIDENGGWP